MPPPCGSNEIQTDFGCIPKDPIGFVEKIYNIGLLFIGPTVFLFLIFGGYFILTSHGDPERLQKGKNFIFYSIAGALLAIFGVVFIEVIAKNILRIPGF